MNDHLSRVPHRPLLIHLLDLEVRSALVKQPLCHVCVLAAMPQPTCFGYPLDDTTVLSKWLDTKPARRTHMMRPAVQLMKGSPKLPVSHHSPTHTEWPEVYISLNVTYISRYLMLTDDKDEAK
jgi:hypothetical protein